MQHDKYEVLTHYMEMNPTTTLKVLRNFGHLFSDIIIDYGAWGNACNPPKLKYLIDLEWYLAECSISAKKIRLFAFKSKRTTAFKTAAMQLPNVTTVHVRSCHFHTSNFSFDANFPNLQSLKLDQHKCNFNIKDWRFPTVKHLFFECAGSLTP